MEHSNKDNDHKIASKYVAKFKALVKEKYRKREELLNFELKVHHLHFIISVLTLLQIGQIIYQYLQYPLQVSVVVASSNSLDFPAISICNANRVRYVWLVAPTSAVGLIESVPSVCVWGTKP